MKIHLAIEQVERHTPLLRALMSASLASTFVVALFVGLSLGVLGSMRILSPELPSTETLAAVGMLDGSITSDALETPEAIFPVQVPGEVLSASAVPSPDPLLEERRREEDLATISNAINEYELTLMRLNAEIERVKEASVALIAQFTVNCGNWKDVCGSAYARDLEVFNTRYDTLIKERNEVTRLRDAAIAERAVLSENP